MAERMERGWQEQLFSNEENKTTASQVLGASMLAVLVP